MPVQSWAALKTDQSQNSEQSNQGRFGQSSQVHSGSPTSPERQQRGGAAVRKSDSPAVQARAVPAKPAQSKVRKSGSWEVQQSGGVNLQMLANTVRKPTRTCTTASIPTRLVHAAANRRKRSSRLKQSLCDASRRELPLSGADQQRRPQHFSAEFLGCEVTPPASIHVTCASDTRRSVSPTAGMHSLSMRSYAAFTSGKSRKGSEPSTSSRDSQTRVPLNVAMQLFLACFVSRIPRGTWWIELYVSQPTHHIAPLCNE